MLLRTLLAAPGAAAALREHKGPFWLLGSWSASRRIHALCPTSSVFAYAKSAAQPVKLAMLPVAWLMRDAAPRTCAACRGRG